ncbi:glycoside hydrolase [candidate division KSB1 bacterium]|nr:glycoside hydrolase [candidate division KSB1 bacterium]
MKRELDLNGSWRFEIGDDPVYATNLFDDSEWEMIRVPGRWEDQGFPGYDGYAWYRTTFLLSAQLRDKTLFIHLGRIDDVDRVYLNGHLINGEGRFPPDFESAYTVDRWYYLPSSYLNSEGANLIAVQVYDDFLEGGIISGSIGIYSTRHQPDLLADLTGFWKFKTGDNLGWADDNFKDADWDSILVPILWEFQGYEDYDGYAWYRKKIIIKNEWQRETLILALGKIDDMDEVYFNGQRIGSTGRFPVHDANPNNVFWLYERFYTIPSSLVRWSGENTIAVRVYDIWIDGGIYEGPIGLMTRESYQKYDPAKQNRIFDFLKSVFFPE